MSGLDDGALGLLRDARRGLAPSPADARRVLAATKARIAAETATAVGSGTVARGAAIGARVWLGRAAWAIVAGIIGGVVGYQLGWRAARETSATTVDIERPAANAETRTNGTPAPASIPPPNPAQPKPAAMLDATEPEPRASEGLRRPKKHAQRSAPATPESESSLDEELRVLRLVERSLRDGDPRSALERLGELDRTVPEGQLHEERDAAFVRARCAVGAGTPASLARDFEDRYPGSVYFARVRQSCGLAAETRVIPTRQPTDQLLPGDSSR